MAVLTSIGRLDMGRVLAGSIRSVVTTETVADNIEMIEVGRDPAIGRVAVITSVAAAYVCRVLVRGDRAIVAGRAGADDLIVVDSVGRHKDKIVVTVFAQVCGLDMHRILANGVIPVVAAEAVGHDIRVLKCCRDPTVRRMAVVAVVSTADMGRVFTCGDHAVMAGRAESDDLGMINRVGGREKRAVMTVFTNIARLDMRRVLADGIGAVVAGGTGADDLGMVDSVSRREEDVVMAVFAGVGCLHVSRILADGVCAVMAAKAIADGVDVVKIGRYPGARCMAVIAGITAGDVSWMLSCRDRAVVAG